MSRFLGLLVVALLIVSACTSNSAPAPGSTKEQAKPPESAKPAESQKPAAEAPKPNSEATKPAAKADIPAKMDVVKLAVVHTVSDAGIYVGLMNGYFKEQGVEIEETKLSTGQEMTAILATGQLDIGIGAPSAGMFNAVARGANIRIVADKGSAPPGFGYVAFTIRKDLADSGAIKDYKDLKGKKIALSGPGILNEYDLFRALKLGGLTFNDVERVYMPFPDMVTALASKSIDVAVCVEPNVAAAVTKGVGVRWKGVDDVYPGHQISAVQFSPQFADQRTDVGKRFMVAYVKGLRVYNDAFLKNKGKAELIKMMMDWSGLKDQAIYDKMVPAGLNPDGYANAKTLSDDLDWFVAEGMVKDKPDLSKIIDNRFADYAVSVLGKYQQ